MKSKITLVLLPFVIFVLYIALTSSSAGINGQSVSGCSCHGAASTSTLVTITGLPAGGYTNGTVYPITVSVTNTSFAGSAGFDLTSTLGNFTAVAGTAINGALEIRHNIPKARVAGTASWTFNWTAPPTGSANVSFFLAGNAVNGDGGTSGDAWNLASTTIFKSGAVLNITTTNTSITCNGGFSTITASGAGPTLPYTFSRNGGAFQASGSFTNNLAGIYTITVRDATLATATTTLTITQPNLLVMGTTSNTPILCNGGNCTVTTSATGGTGTINYRLNLGVYQPSSTFNSVIAGTYTVTARDANLCTKTTSLVITQPIVMVFNNTAATQPLCNLGTNGSLTRTVTGGTGAITYTINPLGPQSNSTGIFTGLSAQTYTVTATDASNCTKTSSVIIGQPTALNFISTIATPPQCNGGVGIISTTASGGTGTKTYTINPIGTSNSTGTFTGLTSQAYTISVSDANGCTKSTVVNLPEPAVLSFNTPITSNIDCNGSDGSINITSNGGTGTINYSISPLGPQINSIGNFSSLTAQTYTITATDANNCSINTDVTVTCGATLNLKLYLQGYYNTSGLMLPALFNQGESLNTSITDSIQVELRSASSPYQVIESKTIILNTNGTALCVFNHSGLYYLSIQHRNTNQTWSAQAINISGAVNYDFSNAQVKAYGGNMIEIESGIWAIYSGDVNQDENTDLLDLGFVEIDINGFAFGYFPTDINGDGNVDLLDIAILEGNVSNFIFSNHP